MASRCGACNTQPIWHEMWLIFYWTGRKKGKHSISKSSVENYAVQSNGSRAADVTVQEREKKPIAANEGVRRRRDHVCRSKLHGGRRVLCMVSPQHGTQPDMACSSRDRYSAAPDAPAQGRGLAISRLRHRPCGVAMDLASLVGAGRIKFSTIGQDVLVTRNELCTTLPRLNTPTSLLDSIFWVVSDTPATAQLYTNSAGKVVVQGNGSALEGGFHHNGVRFQDPLDEALGTEIYTKPLSRRLHNVQAMVDCYVFETGIVRLEQLASLCAIPSRKNVDNSQIC